MGYIAGDTAVFECVYYVRVGAELAPLDPVHPNLFPRSPQFVSLHLGIAEGERDGLIVFNATERWSSIIYTSFVD